MQFRFHSYLRAAAMALLLISTAGLAWADPFVGTSAITTVCPLDRGPFSNPPALATKYADGDEGTATLRQVLMDPGTSDAVREEVFYHLSQRGNAAAAVFIELQAFVNKHPRWELAYTEAMAGVPDRRLIPELIRLARSGRTSKVRAAAVNGLAIALQNRRVPPLPTQATVGPNPLIPMGIEMTYDGGVVSHGQLLLPGDEQPILALYDQMKKSMDPIVRGSLRRLDAAIIRLTPETPNSPAAHSERMAKTRLLADSVAIGTTRDEVEKIFTRQDGGVTGPYATRYYMGNEVMVEVPYDETGGRWKPTNRVTGPLKVYKDTFHTD